MAGQLAAMPGLVWKVWLMDEANHAAGGIYLFGDADAALGFAQQLEGMLRGDPSIRSTAAPGREPEHACDR